MSGDRKFRTLASRIPGAGSFRDWSLESLLPHAQFRLSSSYIVSPPRSPLSDLIVPVPQVTPVSNVFIQLEQHKPLLGTWNTPLPTTSTTSRPLNRFSTPEFPGVGHFWGIGAHPDHQFSFCCIPRSRVLSSSLPVRLQVQSWKLKNGIRHIILGTYVKICLRSPKIPLATTASCHKYWTMYELQPTEIPGPSKNSRIFLASPSTVSLTIIDQINSRHSNVHQQTDER